MSKALRSSSEHEGAALRMGVAELFCCEKELELKKLKKAHNKGEMHFDLFQ